MLKDGQAAVFKCLERCTSFQETTKPCSFTVKHSTYTLHICVFTQIQNYMMQTSTLIHVINIHDDIKWHIYVKAYL